MLPLDVGLPVVVKFHTPTILRQKGRYFAGADCLDSPGGQPMKAIRMGFVGNTT